MVTPPDNKEQAILKKMALLELKAFGKSKVRESELPMEDPAGKVKGEEFKMQVEGSESGRTVSKDTEVPLENATTSKAKAKGKGKGKGKAKAKTKTQQTQVLEKDQTSGKSKEEEIGSPAKDNVIGKGKQNDQSDSDGLRTPRPIDYDTAPESTPLNTIPDYLDIPLSVLQLQLTPTEEQYDAVYSKASAFMDEYVRPQKASPIQIDRFCCLLLYDDVYDKFAPYIEELRWNCAVVEHPDNPMITEILEWTQHLRPIDGLHHPSGISVAPISPGPVTATPVITVPKNKEPEKERPSITKLKEARAKVKPPCEDPLEVLDQREKTILAQMRAGAPLSAAQVLAELTAIGQSRHHEEEKVRLKIAGGRAADMLVKRQKAMAEEDGALAYLPPWNDTC